MRRSFWKIAVWGFLLVAQNAVAQTIYTEPAFPTQNDDIKLFFDATKGNAALSGFTGNVYAHTGVITNQSANGNDWRYVIGEWGKADDRVEMTRESDDLYSLSYNIENFYSIPEGEIVKQLAFVFRNQDGTIVGRDTDGSDIFLEVFEDNSQLQANLIEPTNGLILYLQETLPISLELNQEANIELYLDQRLIQQETAKALTTGIPINKLGTSILQIRVTNETESITIEREIFAIERTIASASLPVGMQAGLNEEENNLIFALTAPHKEHVFLLCPANEFKPDLDFRLTPNSEGDIFWLELPKNLFPEGENYYQYLVDGEITIADPFATTVLDQANDAQLLEPWSDLYPANALGQVSVADIWEEEFPWEINGFDVPQKEELIIYELLLRDFLSDQQFTSLIDTLDYLDRLGINAIELMPIQEFEGNQSWGYNPSFHMALDKAYGTRADFKRIVDECHKRGIAVILDVVYNHAFAQSPLCQLYWNPTKSQPSEDNPWLNETARHPFNVGYDFNHQSPYTQQWVKQVLQYWIEEFRIDGFRFDLSKGFTQTNTIGNPDRMAQYDASRINILTDYADHIWSLDDDNIVILEHFAELSEEQELAAKGMLLWNNNQFQFAEAAMGYNSDLSGADYTARGMDTPSLVTYMESHDEERMAYKISRWGNSIGSYNTKNLETLTERIVAAYTIFITIPGPKMIWQFSELGYDESINRCLSGSESENCRLDPKPVRWQYQNDESRKDLFDKLAALFTFKKNTADFNTSDFHFNDDDPFLKSVVLLGDEMDIVAVANFAVTEAGFNIKFPATGTWYEFYTSEPLEVDQVDQTIRLNPGGYKLYTSMPSEFSGTFSTSVDESLVAPLEIYPNPVGVSGSLLLSKLVDRVQVFDLDGKLLLDSNKKVNSIDISGLSNGLYILKSFLGNQTSSHKIVKVE